MSSSMDMECVPRIKRRCYTSTFKMDLIDAQIVPQASPAIDLATQLQMGPARWDMEVPELKQPMPRPQLLSTMDQLRFSVAVRPDLAPWITAFGEYRTKAISPHGISSTPGIPKSNLESWHCINRLIAMNQQYAFAPAQALQTPHIITNSNDGSATNGSFSSH